VLGMNAELQWGFIGLIGPLVLGLELLVVI
jgi:hypothetical protein